jgi:hypothetical protein
VTPAAAPSVRFASGRPGAADDAAYWPELLLVLGVLLLTKLWLIFFPEPFDYIYGLNKEGMVGGVRFAMAMDLLRGDPITPYLAMHKADYAPIDMTLPFWFMPFAAALGDRAIALRLSVLAMGAVLLALLHRAAWRSAGRNAARLIGLLFALGAPGLWIHNLWGMFDFGVMTVLFYPCFAYALGRLQRRTPLERRELLALGALAGLALGSFVFCAALAAPLALVVRGERAAGGPRTAPKRWALAGLLLGAAPAALLMVASHLQLASLHWTPYERLDRRSDPAALAEKTASFADRASAARDHALGPGALVGLPVMLATRTASRATVGLAGSFEPWSVYEPREGEVSAASWALTGAFWAAFLVLAVRRRRALAAVLAWRPRPAADGRERLAVWALLTAGGMVLLMAAARNAKPYYLHVVHPALYATIALACDDLWRSRATIARAFGTALAGTALTATLAGNLTLWAAPSWQTAKTIVGYSGSSHYMLGAKLSTAVNDRMTTDLIRRAAARGDDPRACDFLMGQIEGMFLGERWGDFDAASRLADLNHPCVWAGFGGLALPSIRVFPIWRRDSAATWAKLEAGVARASEWFSAQPSELAPDLYYGFGYKLSVVGTPWRSDPRKLDLLLALPARERCWALAGYERSLIRGNFIDRLGDVAQWRRVRGDCPAP